MFFLSLCALLFIAAVVYLAVQCGYVGTACFTAFCVAATVYLLCMWVGYPQLWRTASLVRPVLLLPPSAKIVRFKRK